MKTLIISIITVFSISFSQMLLAHTTVIEETKGWSAVPIVVDTENRTYITPNFYYSYKGYRCFAERKNFAGIDALIFHASVSSGTDIYCYPE